MIMARLAIELVGEVDESIHEFNHRPTRPPSLLLNAQAAIGHLATAGARQLGLRRGVVTGS